MKQICGALLFVVTMSVCLNACGVTQSDAPDEVGSDSSMPCADGTRVPCGHDGDVGAGLEVESGTTSNPVDLGIVDTDGQAGSMDSGSGGADDRDAGGDDTADTGVAGGNSLALNLDLRCAVSPVTTVRLVGPLWNNWDPNSGPVASDADGNGIWSVTFEPAPVQDLEYLWNVDGVYERLLGSGACAPRTDGVNYANRIWPTSEGSRTDTYNTCDACDGGMGAGDSLPRITVEGRRILVDGIPFHMKGVNWNPVPRGQVHPAGLDYAGLVGRDAPLMEAAGINVVRTYETILDQAVLDAFWARGIYVMSTVYAWGGAPVDSVIAKVMATREHPAILMWAVGNEWNYNGLYNGMNTDQSIQRLNDVIRLVKETDPTRPVVTVYGDVPSREILARMPGVDVWGLNVYRGLGFGDLFDAFASRSEKPMFLGEYGADAYNAITNAEDQTAQAEATRVLTQLIIDESTINGGPCSGGLLFEWADEWWKAAGDPNVHDTGGVAPGGGPHPDGVFNEEWWGILEIDGTPRDAYRVFRDMPVPRAN
ncbi:MAG: glycoside hydrolase family 2 TIM barrel-domain containing protein [Myxococcota bacterium]|nr:glycoside hydrolase family 2 TIM barrel-domain containing protein [Myxococcota bacterium]